MSLFKTNERVVPQNFHSENEYIIYLRHLFAYNYAKLYVKKNYNIIDIGCGTGYGLHELANFSREAVGIDVDSESILYAAEHFMNTKLHYECFDGIKIPYEKNYFDLAVSFQVIEHVENAEISIEEIHRVLKDNGQLILTTPNKTNRLEPGQKPWNKYHKREFYPAELKDLLLTKFSKVKMYGITGNTAINTIEMQRIASIQRLAHLHILKLKNYMPDTLNNFILKIIRRADKFDVKHSTFKINDYRVTAEQIDDSLDLLAICTK